MPPSAQAPRPQGEIPYLSAPPFSPPGSPSAGAAATPNAAAPPPSALEALRKRDQDLEAIRAAQKKALENEAKLKAEIESIGSDRRKLNQQLIDTAARIRGVEEQAAATQDRLAPLEAREGELRKSLEARSAVMAEVLAALQRMGRRPPPVLMVESEDALKSVRTAMMLGAVVPGMRREVEALITDLGEHVRLRQALATERDSLTRDLAPLGDERQRLAMLTEQRQKQQADTEQALDAERRHAAQLGREAANLRDLIAKLEQELNPKSRGTRATEDKKAFEGRPDLAALNDPGRLAPAVAFAAARGMLPLPVNGVRIKEFGASDGVGGNEKGLSLASRPGAQITAPCDGWVVYAGPFRNYGQLLILNAGGGYHVLLAGMDRISADLGQFVVTGEPVGVMGGGGRAAAISAGSGQPVLYVEFRKDGTPVDPSPWWAKTEGEKVRG